MKKISSGFGKKVSYNKTRKEREQRAASDLAKKLKLEIKLEKEMQSIFKSISHSAKSLYLATGSKFNAWSFKDQFKNALIKHYERVFKSFQPEMIDSINTAVNKSDVPTNLDIFNNQYIENQSDAQANTITNTTQKKLNQAYGAAIAAYVAPDGDVAHDTPVDRAVIAEQATNTFDADSDSRSAIIATTETQASAETAKSNVIASALDPVEQGRGKKDWVTIMDGRERQSHHEANGQVQGLESPFIVQGQMLSYPGDTSLGATIDNWINCRCSAQYSIPT